MQEKGMLRKTLFLFLIFVFLTPGIEPGVRASEPAAKNAVPFFYPEIISRDARHVFQTGSALLCAPLHFGKKQWVLTGTVTGTTALLFALDPKIQRFVLRHQNRTNATFFNTDHYYGNKLTVLGVLGLYGTGYVLKNKKLRLLGLHTAEAMGYAGSLTIALKILLGRRRPYGGANARYFQPFQGSNLYQSLPSGHTTVAFAVSTVLAHASHNFLWKTFWYTAATLVAASRVYHNQHWASDVFLGGAIGTSVGIFVGHRKL